MKQFLSTHGRTMMLAGILLPLFGLFAYVTMRSGPLAPIPVTLMTVERRELTPSLFGIGTVEARYTHKIGINCCLNLGKSSKDNFLLLCHNILIFRQFRKKLKPTQSVLF